MRGRTENAGIRNCACGGRRGGFRAIHSDRYGEGACFRNTGIIMHKLAIPLVVLLSVGATASAQGDVRGLVLRSVSISTGYTAVQLPPVTLGGFLPNDVFGADLITSSGVDLSWNRSTARTTLGASFAGTYTMRAKYPGMNSFGTNASLELTRRIGRFWRASLSATEFITDSEQ